jgi:hypothetical protein
MLGKAYFTMFMQSLHLKKCGMVQSEFDPCIYYKIMQRDGGNEPDDDPILEEYLIAITWVDDVRYFGTEKLVKEYEEQIAKNCKCTFARGGIERVRLHWNLPSSRS